MESQSSSLPRPVVFLTRVLGVEPEELRAVAWSFLYFFCIMSAYFMLRSVRESMALVSGVATIPWLFTGTFILMLIATPIYGLVTSKYPRRIFLPWVYYFFIANILIFFAIFTYAQSNGLSLVWISRAFFVWLSVFNLYVVSVFWSFMADIYTRQQSRRLFGVISAGGSSGAILGPLLTSVLVVPFGFENLLPISASLLLVSVYCVYRLRHWVQHLESDENTSTPLKFGKAFGGSAMAGLTMVLQQRYFAMIAIALLCANFLGGAMYMYIAQMVSVAFEDTNLRTQFFARMDLAVNVLSFILQLLVVRHSVKKLGIGWTLTLLPVLSVVGFAILAINPIFAVIVGFNVIRRAVGFGFSKPTSDMLYSIVSPEAKYKAKNFIDTTVYRGWDVVATWSISMLGAIGVGLAGVALICVPVGLAWMAIARWIGREYKRRDQATLADAST
jgi:AAA family ATP:ADP antiporter